MAMIPRYSCLPLVLLCLCNTYFSNALSDGFSVEIIHRDSSQSPFYRSTETHFQRVVNAVRRSINRANHFNKPSSVSPNTPYSTVIPDQGEYLMTYSVGTPPFKLLGIVDTGSDIIWLQCLPCKECYKQTTPIFNPSKSKTYRTLPCTSPTCQAVSSTSCSPDQICEYTINYGDRSHSQGDLSIETLTLPSIKGAPVQFPRTALGCGHENTGSFQGKSSGIVGLGLGPVSLITQLNTLIEGKFSYCLVPMLSNFTSKLNFGKAAVVSGAGTVSTPLVLQDEQPFYFLTLEGFSVGNKRINFQSVSTNEEGNIIIDSGTTLTLLPDDVYSNIESEVADAVKLPRAEDPSQVLSLCYKSASDKLDVPVITAHFSGADVKLNSINTFVRVADDVVCLAFMSSDIGTIFGNLAQQNFLVGYDLQNKLVFFKPTDCTVQ